MTTGWLSDSRGRVDNISLAPNAKNALFPLFEAVMNSIHAIEERFGPDNLSQGTINITVHENADNAYSGFTIVDNGIGFNKSNIESFQKFDSRKKIKIGGKGVGRLLWLKVSEKTKVSSTYLDENSEIKNITFDFNIENPIDNVHFEGTTSKNPFTSIAINPYKSEYATKLPKKLDTIANRTVAHFVSFFTNMSHPTIIIEDQHIKIDLFDNFSEKVKRDEDYSFTLENLKDDFIIHCFLLPKAISDDEKSVNALYLGANSRAVSRHDMDSVLGMKAISGQYAFLGYVESSYLDKNVNDSRTSFSLDEDQISEIIDKAKEKAKEFLEPEIQEIRQSQKDKIISIGRDYPRFFYDARNADSIANRLHLSTQSEEEIFIELSRRYLREYKKRKKTYETAYNKSLPDVAQQTEKFMQTLKEDATSSLAEYVARRKSILEIFEAGLKFTNIEKETSHYEKIVHGIICPLNSTTEELTYENHNLWLLDDRLAFYTYFNSDKPMSKQLSEKSASKDRPDITLLDISIGFTADDNNYPITIVEFKRPKRDDYTLMDNPITQVRSYVEQIRRSKEAIKFDGTPLRTISPETPFTCHIVADITPSLEATMKGLGQFTQRAGTSSYYWWDANYNIFIEISSFKEILSSAKARNQAFFEKLGID